MHIYNRVFSINVATFLLAVSGINTEEAVAQGSNVLEEVVVTARRVEENLQEVPISVTAYSATELERAGVSNVVDIQYQVPNLRFRENSEPTGVFVTMRGRAASNNHMNTDSPMGLYLDGVNLARTRNISTAMFDSERVEVLKGPQGTLYGRNTTGGAMNIISKKPTHDDDVSGYAEGNVGNRDYLQLGAAVNVPVSDSFAVRLAAQRLKHDGFSTQVLEDGPDGQLDDTDEKFVRGSALWDPTENINLHLVADYARLDSSGRGVHINGYTGNLNSNLYRAVATELGLVAFNVNPSTAIRQQAKDYILANFPRDNFNLDYGTSPLDRGAKLEDYGMGLTATIETTYFDITSISGYRTFNLDYSSLLSSLPFQLHRTESYDEQEFLSEEVRLNGLLLNDRLNWQAGAYYSYEDAFSNSEGNTNTLINFNLPSVTRTDFKNKSWALFAQTGYTLTEALQITTGLRFTEEDKAIVAQNFSGNAATPDPNDGTCVVPPAGLPLTQCFAPFSDTWGKWSWLVAMDYNVTDDAMVYVSAGSSWLGGGQNHRGSVTAQSFRAVNPETVVTYEAGFKVDWLENRLRTNLAVFHSDFKDMHARTRVLIDAAAQTTTNAVTNAATATIRGFELDVEARPIDGLSLRAGVGHIDPEYKEFFDIDFSLASGLLDRSGEAFQGISKWQYVLNGRYEQPMWQGIVGLNLNYSWMGKVDNNFTTTDPTVPSENLIIDSYGLVNLRLDYRLEDLGWEFAIWGNNVLDKQYLGRIEDFTANGWVLAFPGKRKLWGMEVRKQF